MFQLLATSVLAVAEPAGTVPSPSAADPCAGQQNCRQASAAQLFDLADRLFQAGDLVAAEEVLVALTQDPAPELRAEARFRLSALREKRGDIDGAIEALRGLLAEQPGAGRARLELSRLLALKGDDRAARRELRLAEAGGLPPEVAVTVKRFSSSLQSMKRRGVSLELVGGPDSNINRSTSAQFIDTVIAPFALDPDARGQSGIGLTVGGQLWSRDRIIGAELLTRAGLRGDFFSKSRFNDIQFSLSSGPEFITSVGRFRPALTHERRWYGGDAYSTGYGASLNWVTSPSSRSQVEIDSSVVRQAIRNNDVQDGYRYTLGAALNYAFTPRTTGRVGLRASALDAEAKPESVTQLGADLLAAHNFGAATLFAQAGYTRSNGAAPIALFGKTRADDRFDLGGGLVANALSFGGFAPLVRVTYTNSASNIVLYDYKRTRVDLGLSREF